MTPGLSISVRPVCPWCNDPSPFMAVGRVVSDRRKGDYRLSSRRNTLRPSSTSGQFGRGAPLTLARPVPRKLAICSRILPWRYLPRSYPAKWCRYIGRTPLARTRERQRSPRRNPANPAIPAWSYHRPWRAYGSGEVGMMYVRERRGMQSPNSRVTLNP